MGRFVMRKNQRFREAIPIQYRRNGIVGEGMVKDLSLTGWQISGDVPVSVGMRLTLRVSLPGEREPLRIDHVTVQWVKGLEFGVELGSLSREVHTQIERVIAALVEKRHGSPPRG